MGAKEFKAELEQVYGKYKANFPRLKRELNRLLKEGEESQDIYQLGAVNYYFALMSYYKGVRSQVFSYAFKAATMLEETSDYDLLARSYNMLGIAYFAEENYQLAIAAYNRAYQITREHKGCSLLPDVVRNNTAECYQQMGDYRKSIKMFSACLSNTLRKRAEDHEAIAIYGINLAACYEGAGEYDKAEETLAVAENVIHDGVPKMVVSGFYARRACVAYKQDDTQTGNRYADLTIESVKDYEDTYELHRDFEQIAHAQIKIGEYDRADRFGNVLLAYYRKSGHVLDRIIAYRVQADYFNTINNTAVALKYYRRLNSLYEKRLMEEKAMQLSIQNRIEATERELQHMMKKIKLSEENAEREPLTGLLNRTALVKTANDFIERAKDGDKKIGGIFIDIDYFKEYNDTYGHARGDEAIRAVAAACRKLESASVKFARYGGDEFFAIIFGRRDAEVNKIAADICAAVRAANILHEKNPNGRRVTLSVGVVNASMADGDSTILDIVNYADKALYQAKRFGRDMICAYDAHGASDEHAAFQTIKF